MPTYQYACTECGHAFDQVQKFTDDTLTVCPVCEGKLRKIYNAVGVVFKGNGFYHTDSRSGGASGDPAKSDSSSSDTTSDSSDKPAKTESAGADKPAKKAEASTPSTTTSTPSSTS